MRLKISAVLFVFLFAAAAHSEDLSNIAKQLGLPKNATEADILKAISALKAPAPAPQKSAVAKASDHVDAHTATGCKYVIADPVLGSSEEPGTWYGRAEAIFYSRYGFERKVEYTRRIVLGPPVLSIPVLNSDDLDRDSFEPGGRGTVGYQWTKATSFEFTFFSVIESQDEARVRDPNNLLRTHNDQYGFLTGFNGAAEQKIASSTRLYSGEFNVRHRLSDLGFFAPTFFAGLRYLDINESFKFQSYRRRPLLNASDAQNIFKSNAANHLIGLQAGTELVHQFNCWSSIGVKGDVGVLANMMDRRAELSAQSGSITQSTRGYKQSDDSVGIAGLAEFGVFATFHPAKHVDLRLGYDAKFITGLALAEQQVPQGLDFGALSPAPGVSGAIPHRSLFTNSGSLLYHGPTIGLTIKF